MRQPAELLRGLFVVFGLGLLLFSKLQLMYVSGIKAV